MTDEKHHGERRQAWTIKALNWADYQHYKDRDPPWIKLHRQLLDKPEWRRLSGNAGKLLMDVWMLAAQHGGEVNLRLTDLGYRLRVKAPRLASGLLELRGAELLALSEPMLADASAAQANATQRRDRGETEAEAEAQKKTTKSAPVGAARLHA